MEDHPNIQKPPTQLLSSPSPPPPAPHRSSMPILYYGLVVVATAAIVLAIYNLIVIRWCATQYRHSHETNRLPHHRRNTTTRNNIMPPPSALHRSGSSIGLTSSFRYKKGHEEDNNNSNNNSNSNSNTNNNETQLDYDIECSVCLSVFEDGEEVRKLPVCKHSFHASCIDMWLYSHFDCPLCRATVVLLPLQATPSHHQHTDFALSEQLRDGLIDRANSST